jgi:hypothetical protein
VAVDLPELDDVAVVAQRPVPGNRVLVVGIDQGAVDIEDNGGRFFGRHLGGLPALAHVPNG